MHKNKSTLGNTKIHNRTNWVLLIGVILIGSNLRAPLTSVGSLISFIRDDLGISNTLAGTITTLPLLAFAFLSPFAPKIANRIGMEWTIFIALFILAIGIVIRSSFGVSSLFVGTILIGVAITIGNVLLPGFIKMYYPFKIGIMTGIYAVSMNIFGALGSGLSVPLASFKGVKWQGSLAFWVILSFIAILFWIPQLRKRSELSKTINAPLQKGKSVWYSPLAWSITLFMGLQSLIYYTFVTWLPDILQLYGYSPGAAGWMLFLLLFALIPATFVIPVIAERMKNQKLLSGINGILFIVGVIGIMLGNKTLMPLAVIFIGIACGSSFSLSMMFFSLRTKSGQQAAEVSGMAQSFGYFLAAIGPVLFGAIHDLTGGWTLPLSILIVISGLILIFGVQAGRDRFIAGFSKEKLSAD